MTRHTPHHDLRAQRAAPCLGAAGIDAGNAPGLAVMNSIRPALPAGTARGLRKQFVAAH